MDSNLSRLSPLRRKAQKGEKGEWQKPRNQWFKAQKSGGVKWFNPITAIGFIYIYIYTVYGIIKNQANVGKGTIHGCYGVYR